VLLKKEEQEASASIFTVKDYPAHDGERFLRNAGIF
jgi:hypothetical protein